LRSSCTSRNAGGSCTSRLLATVDAFPSATLPVSIAIWMFLVFTAGQANAQAVALPLLPTSVAYDAAGNLYFADTNRHEVYESSLAGVLSVVAGDGVQGFSGDGGAATSAELDSPQGVAIGSDGTLYIADTGNERIRAVSGGVITTFAGNGSAGFAGDGGAAMSASLRGPNALAIDTSGALLVCDAGNERVRQISAGVIQTVAGNGTQGFAGDGGPATSAELDTPMGLAVGANGQIYVADSHNNRIRVIAANGTISTFAGSGVQGYAGDGGAATAAELALPRGLMVMSAGAVIFADSNNQRIRMVSASGAITTIAGSGVQGSVSDGNPATSAAMNSPRGVAVSSFGAPVYADALNQLVRESIANGNVYVPAGLAPSRTSSVALTVSPSATNGQTNASVAVAGLAGTPQGVVELLDGSSLLTQVTLAGGTASFAPQTLSAGAHSLSAVYMGDGVNPAATSTVVGVSVGVQVVTATANAASMMFGQQVPVLTGSLSGVLPQDIGNVSAVFTTTAGSLSPTGRYPITATLTGPASTNYSVVMSASSGSLQIVQAPSVTVEQPLAQNSYTGLPLLLTANVNSTTQGVPTGTVQFLDNGTMVATAVLVNGVASGTYLSPSVGSQSIVANYGGDGNFATSTSQAQTATVSPVPDFTMAASGSSTQTVAEGDVANYALTVGAQSGAFTGAVDFSAAGLPPGATVSFSPPQVVPGTTSTNVTMSVQTSNVLPITATVRRYGIAVFACLLLPWLLIRRRGRVRPIAMCGVLTLLIGGAGCGARSISTAALDEQTYTLTITGTSTNLAGVVVSHSMQVTLIVEQ
jgi:Bacterial Ig-like domain (group 3)/MBG domain (YGX type)/NHL repeat